MSNSPSFNMRFDICSIEDKKNVLYNFPELKEIESFRDYPGAAGGELNQDMVVKYVVILYSEDSFLNTRPAKELGDRKLMAAEAAGFPRNKQNEFEEDVTTKLFNLSSFEVLRMAVDYLIFQKKHLWTEIVTTEQEYEEYIRLRLDPVSSEHDKDTLMAADKKSKLRSDCKMMLKDLKVMYKEMFTDNSDVEELHDIKDKATLERRARKA